MWLGRSGCSCFAIWGGDFDSSSKPLVPGFVAHSGKQVQLQNRIQQISPYSKPSSVNDWQRCMCVFKAFDLHCPSTSEQPKQSCLFARRKRLMKLKRCSKRKKGRDQGSQGIGTKASAWQAEKAAWTRTTRGSKASWTTSQTLSCQVCACWCLWCEAWCKAQEQSQSQSLTKAED